jgi:hypothetical protein
MDLRAEDLGNPRKLIGVMNEKITRLIAFEVRPRRVAYAAFEIPARLLDWGTRSVGPNPTADGRITGILRAYRPSVLVLRGIRPGGRRDNPRTKKILSAIEAEAKRLTLTVAFLTERQLEVFFRQHGQVTKHQIAQALGEWFPELSTLVPPPRKPWQPEHWRTVIFDAVATAVAYLAAERIDPGGG